MENKGTLVELTLYNSDGFEDEFKTMEIWESEIAKESVGEHEDPYNGGFYHVKIIREATSEDFLKYKNKINN